MIDVDVIGVRVEMPANQPVLLLRESSGHRYLPIWIGAVEATAIAFAQQGIEPPRPLTHDLMRDLLEHFGKALVTVQIVALEDGVFYAELVFDDGSVLSARPSDAIALALRTGAVTKVADEVLASAGVDAPADEEHEVEAFREFLDSVSPEDFSGGEETPS
ncbi:MAG: bifunctional nuclease family protein [Actinomycetes bacterium]